MPSLNTIATSALSNHFLGIATALSIPCILTKQINNRKTNFVGIEGAKTIVFKPFLGSGRAAIPRSRR